MNKYRVLLVSAILFLGCHSRSTPAENNVTNSTQNSTPDTTAHIQVNLKPLDKGVIIDTVNCAEDASQRYAIYLPGNYTADKKWPIIFFFDPHGVGNLPLRIYKDLAEKYGYIIAGTYNSKNGMQIDATEKVAHVFAEDVKRRVSVNNSRIYTFGFSGGARVACSVALDEGGIAGVVACGGGFPKANPTIDQPFACLFFVGDKDFNYIELKSLDRQLDNTPLPHMIEVYHGKHQWPPATVAEEAFQWFNLCAMRDKSAPKNDSIIKVTEHKFQTDIDKYRSQKNDVQLYFTYKKMLNFLRDLTDLGTYSAAYETLGNSDKIKTYLNDQKKDESQEATVQQEFMNYVSDKNDTWWESTVKDLRGYIKKDSNSPVAQQNQRLLSFLSLVTYMTADRAFKQMNDDATGHFLKLYALVDPANPEHEYMYAEIYARENMNDKAINYLQSAVKLGFTDVKRMKSDANFAKISTMPEFQELIKKMSKAAEKIDYTQ